MPALDWSPALELGLAPMDHTHREFVELLAGCQRCADADLAPRWAGLIDHTEDHFGREDRWMRETGFASENCHTVQHRVVLSVMREGARMADEGRLAEVRRMADELADWFVAHAQTMDAALALHLRSVAHDPATGAVGLAHALPAQPLATCGSGGCG